MQVKRTAKTLFNVVLKIEDVMQNRLFLLIMSHRVKNPHAGFFIILFCIPVHFWEQVREDLPPTIAAKKKKKLPSSVVFLVVEMFSLRGKTQQSYLSKVTPQDILLIISVSRQNCLTLLLFAVGLKLMLAVSQPGEESDGSSCDFASSCRG